MPISFLEKLLGRIKRSNPASSFGSTGSNNYFGNAGILSQDTPKESRQVSPDTAAKTKTHSLFAFVDLKDPFAPGEIAGEDLPGPILSILSAKPFDSVFLIYTPQTRENATATEAEIVRRHPGCHVHAQQLPVSNPKDYSSIMGSLWRYGRDFLRQSDTNENYVCVSSGTAEMRAVWFLLTTLGIVKAKLLQVGTPIQPLFGKVNVKELRLDTADWQTIRDLALPAESFLTGSRALVMRPHSTAATGPRKISLTKSRKKDRQVAPDSETLPRSKELLGAESTGDWPADATALGFDQAFVEQMRLAYGETLTNLLRGLLRKFRLTGLPLESVEALAGETLRRVAVGLGAASVRQGEISIDESADVAAVVRALPQPESFAAFVNSVANNVLVEHYRASQTVPEIEKFDLEEPNVLNELKLTPGQLEGLRQGMPAEDRTAAKVPLGGGKETEAGVSSNRRLETLESNSEVIDAAPAPAHEADAQFLRDRLAVPGLDDALQELGIYVGSAVLRHAAERAGIAAESHLPVLLLGETGTGKERFAQLIHRISPRRMSDLVAINCAAIPESLAEDYLFGHIKGAFSGAHGEKKGMFESADRSTLFLDEIAELSLEVQAKLLRVIQDNVIHRLGSTTPRKVDVRIIAASNRDLRNEVSAGRFREDLYFRLEVVQVKLPALRERRSEIPELAIALLKQINQRIYRPRQLSSSAVMRLEKYDWPGNVRQLSNVLERSVLYARKDVIQAEDLLIVEDPPEKDTFATLPEPRQGFRIEDYLAQVREQLFVRALAVCKGNQTEAAELLGVSKQAVSKFVSGRNDNSN